MVSTTHHFQLQNLQAASAQKLFPLKLHFSSAVGGREKEIDTVVSSPNLVLRREERRRGDPTPPTAAHKTSSPASTQMTGILPATHHPPSPTFPCWFPQPLLRFRHRPRPQHQGLISCAILNKLVVLIKSCLKRILEREEQGVIV